MDDLRDLIKTKRLKLGVIGLGYVGLPLALEFAARGFRVTGFDVDASKVRALNRGRSYIPDVSSEAVREFVKKRRLAASARFDGLAACDAVVICVPTPLRKTKDPDISYIIAAVKEIKQRLRRGQLVVLESTTYPGTTREVVLPMLEETGLKCGKDFWLAFSPERIDPGNKHYGLRNTPKVVGGVTPECAALTRTLYGAIIQRIVPVSSTECAEMVKLLENTFRAVNIGLVNEVAMMCRRLKLDTWEVIEAAASKPFGFMPFYPGPGLGGHCIPLDPHYLAWKLKTLNFYARFIELAGEINSHMPEFLVTIIADALNARGKSIKGARLLVLGVAYKKDIGDLRESPALDVMELLRQKGARLSYHDPYVPEVRAADLRLRSVPLTAGRLAAADAAIITTHHSRFDVRRIVNNSRLVVDARNATAGLQAPHIVKL
jgi:UDP-N-acetyl-D-glucosamine dehydrogenase